MYAAALATIRSVFGEPVLYSGAGASESATITVIWSDVAGETFQGAGNTRRTISAEISKADLPARPSKGDRLVRDGVTWAPNEIVDRDDVGAWSVVLVRQS